MPNEAFETNRSIDKRPVNLDGYINEWPEMGFVANEKSL